MGEQLANGNAVLVAPAKGRDVVHHRIVEPDLFLVVEDHDRRRGADDLGQRGDVVDGALRVDRSAALAPGKPAESPLKNRRSLSADYDGSAGVATCLYAALDNALDRSQPTAGHANVC